jgi:RNA-directed DNA polymerase
MEERIKVEFPTMKKTNRETWFHKKGENFYTPNIIRYADDFVILHEDITVVQRCQSIISEWLSDMGLELKPSKTHLCHTLNKHEDFEPGFNFLSFNVRQFPAGKYQSGKSTNSELLGFKTIITPSKEKMKVHYDRVADIIESHKAASQVILIGHLNPVIIGWANFYSTVVSKAAYAKQDYLMYQKLWAWAKRRHSKKKKKWIVKRYWQTIGDDNWVFATAREGKNPMQLRKHSATKIERHTKVEGKASPYDGNLVYWGKRMREHPELSLRETTLLKRQKGKCTHCGLFFKDGDILEVDHITPKSKGGRGEYKNLQLLHRHCHDTKTTNDDSLGKKSGCDSTKPKARQSGK